MEFTFKFKKIESTRKYQVEKEKIKKSYKMTCVKLNEKMTFGKNIFIYYGRCPNLILWIHYII